MSLNLFGDLFHQEPSRSSESAQPHILPESDGLDAIRRQTYGGNPCARLDDDYRYTGDSPLGYIPIDTVVGGAIWDYAATAILAIAAPEMTPLVESIYEGAL